MDKFFAVDKNDGRKFLYLLGVTNAFSINENVRVLEGSDSLWNNFFIKLLHNYIINKVNAYK